MQHIGQDWRKKHLAFALEVRLMKNKVLRDTWTDWVANAVIRLRGEPLAKTMPHTQMFQRKMACWYYNQYGNGTREYHTIPNIDPEWGVPGALGTREWVPWFNRHQAVVHMNIKNAKTFVHRVHYRGYGTCPHLVKGKWSHRWSKVLEREAFQKSRV